jgi:hypothetical protein
MVSITPINHVNKYCGHPRCTAGGFVLKEGFVSIGVKDNTVGLTWDQVDQNKEGESIVRTSATTTPLVFKGSHCP